MTILCEGDFVIVGETLDGKKFQPSDWAERLGGTLSALRNRRVVYSPLLMPLLIDGTKSLRVAIELKAQYPAIYEEIENFAKINQLQVICEVPAHA
ncbi:MAG: DUF3579 domain-containing protein [Gammaproteobacteria bacterium]|nr:DUF3579 domain-containing protein [Gammaproteobacteria bacterium]